MARTVTDITDTTKAKDEVLFKKNRIRIPYAVYQEAYGNTGEYCNAVAIEGVATNAQYIFEVSQLPPPLLQAIHAHPKLPKSVKDYLDKLLNQSPEEIFSSMCDTPEQFGLLMGMLAMRDTPPIEMELDGIWYPVMIRSGISRFFGMSSCYLDVEYDVIDKDYEHSWNVSSGLFTSASGAIQQKSVRDVLAQLRLRPITEGALENYKKKLLKMDELYKTPGKAVTLRDNLLHAVRIGWHELLMPHRLGTVSVGLVEPELEAEQHKGKFPLPLVRVFCMDLKKYCYIDVDRLGDYEFDQTAKDRLILPPFMKQTLDAVFMNNRTAAGDIFRNRNGGVIVLAVGVPGVGKTLTAEVYADFMKRPLYVMDIGELGATVASVEDNLQQILDRARRWNAVLLMDEADIFLTARDANHLERSAIVGIFLRILDKYEGTLFLTTNRPDSLDFALRSRVTISLKYPELQNESRLKVWQQLLTNSGIELTKAQLDGLVERPFNGRNIRNAVKIFSLLNPGTKTLTDEAITNALTLVSM